MKKEGKRLRAYFRIGRWRTHYPRFFGGLAALALIILSWGVWKLLDGYLFPEDPLLAALTAIFAASMILYAEDAFLKS